MAQTFNYPLNLASGIASTVSSIFIPTNATIGNVFYNTLTVGNMLSNNLNLGSSSMFSGSFSASNNQVSPANVTGLIFNSSNINYFQVILTVNITTSVPSILNAVYTIRGNFNASGWAIAVSYIGDNTGITFSINSVTGQISYTSTNISFWTSNIFRYRVEQITNTGTYTSLIAGATTSNYSFSTLQILSTTDAIPGGNIGALSVSGGVTIAKELFVGGSSFFNTAGSLGINTTNISYTLDVNGIGRFSNGISLGYGTTLGLNIFGLTNTRLIDVTFQNSNDTTQIYTPGNSSSTPKISIQHNGNIGINTTNPRTNLEIVGTSSTTGMMLYSGANDGGVNRIIFNHSNDSSNFQKVQIQTQALGGSQFAKANFAICLNTENDSTNATFADSKFFISGSSGNVGISTTAPNFKLDVNGNTRFSSTLSATFNSNTLGNLFTTGGNVGINTIAPVYPLDVNGTLAIRSNVNGPSNALFISNTNSGSSTYTICSIGNDTPNNLSIFLNSSTRTVDGGIRTATIRNDGGPLRLQSIGSTGIYLSTGGNIGIDTTSPSYNLDVNGNAKFFNRVDILGIGRFHNSGSQAFVQFYNTSGNNIPVIFCNNNVNQTFFTIATNGNINIVGALSKGSGTFDIPHPILPQKRLVHSFIEGPRCDLIYRGSVQLSQGSALVNIDRDSTFNTIGNMTQGTFEALTANPVCYLQNNVSFDRVKGTINTNILSILCENNLSNDTIDWMVIAERKDPFIKEWERTDTDGYLVTEYNTTF